MSAEGPPDTSERARSLKREPGQRSKRAVCFETPRDGGERVRLAKDIEPRYADSITVSEPDGRAYDDALPDSPLPGSGPEYERCGEDIPLRACDDCGSPTWVGNTCRRSRCPRCWQSWVFQRAVEAATAVDSTRAAMYDRTAGNVYNHHVVVSPPDGIRFNSDDPRARFMDAGKVLLGHVNALAGFLVFHPNRIKEAYRGDVNGHESGDGDMQWKDIMNMPADERDEYLVHEPHLHAFIASPNVSEPDVYDETGFVIHRIADDDGKSLGDMSALCRAVAYSLSHAGLEYNDTDDSYQVAAHCFGETAQIERKGWIRERVEETMREVAGNVLGVSFQRNGCQEPAVDDDHDHGESDDRDGLPPGVNALAAGGTDDGDSGPSGSAGGSGFGSSGNTGGFATDSEGPDARGMPSMQLDSDDDHGHDHDHADGETCGGKLRPIHAVYQKMLENDDWRESIGETADDLREAHDEWEDMGEPTADELPQVGPPAD